jgi:ADP-ribose pyrophosphatase YjhB (NUDIX family)
MKLVGPVLSAVHQARCLYWRLFQPTILGVRALIVDRDRVMLVRHTYLRGYYLPGGRVERGETAYQAMCREVLEECGLIVVQARPVGLYSNAELNCNDHILLFEVEKFEVGQKMRRFALEIAEAGFFDLLALPHDTSPATHRRLAERARGTYSEEYW